MDQSANSVPMSNADIYKLIFDALYILSFNNLSMHIYHADNSIIANDLYDSEDEMDEDELPFAMTPEEYAKYNKGDNSFLNFDYSPVQTNS